RRRPPARPSAFLIGWIGMRGIVSLAAALALPLATASGAPFPFREDIILLTFSVIIVTLVLQGLTLAPLLRRLGLRADFALAEEEERARDAGAAGAGGGGPRPPRAALRRDVGAARASRAAAHALRATAGAGLDPGRRRPEHNGGRGRLPAAPPRGPDRGATPGHPPAGPRGDQRRDSAPHRVRARRGGGTDRHGRAPPALTPYTAIVSPAD